MAPLTGVGSALAAPDVFEPNEHLRTVEYQDGTASQFRADTTAAKWTPAWMHDSANPDKTFPRNVGSKHLDQALSWPLKATTQSDLNNSSYDGPRSDARITASYQDRDASGAQVPLVVNGKTIGPEENHILGWNAIVQGGIENRSVSITPDVSRLGDVETKVGGDGVNYWGDPMRALRQNHAPFDMTSEEMRNKFAAQDIGNYVSETFGTGQSVIEDGRAPIINTDMVELAKLNYGVGPVTGLRWAYYSPGSSGSAEEPKIYQLAMGNDSGKTLYFMEDSSGNYDDVLYFQATSGGVPAAGAILEVVSDAPRYQSDKWQFTDNSWSSVSNGSDDLQGEDFVENLSKDVTAFDGSLMPRGRPTLVANKDGMVAIKLDTGFVKALAEFGSNNQFRDVIKLREVQSCYDAATFEDSLGNQSLGVVTKECELGRDLSLHIANSTLDPYEVKADPDVRAVPTCDGVRVEAITSPRSSQVPRWSTITPGLNYNTPYDEKDRFTYHYTLRDNVATVVLGTMTSLSSGIDRFFPEDVQTEWVIELPDKLTGEGCDIEVTPVAPALTTPVCDAESTVVLPETDGITYTQTREGNVVTVVATADEGYALAEGFTSTWELTIPPVEDCDVVVAPVAPTLGTPTCDAEAEVLITDTQGITFTQDRDGNVVTVTATADEGYVLAEGSISTWELTIPEVEDCGEPWTPIEPSTPLVTPVAPTLGTPTCDAEAEVLTTDTQGITFTQDRGGNTVTITATADEGYALHPDATAEWTLTIPEVEDCGEPWTPIEPSTPLVTPVAPTLTTPECGAEATVVLPETDGITYAQTRDGNIVTVVATADEGYALHPDAVAEWTLTIPEVEDCGIPWTPLEPSIPGEEDEDIPLTPLEPAEPVEEEDEVVVTPPADDDDLPVTGFRGVATAIGASALLLAGAGATIIARRKAGEVN